MKRSIVLFALCVTSQASLADVSAIATGGATVNPVQVSAGVWDFTVVKNNSDNPSTVTFKGSSTDSIRNLTIYNNTSQFVNLIIRADAGIPLASVGTVDARVGSGAGGVLIPELLTSGNLGSVYVSVLQFVRIGGSVTGTIDCTYPGVPENRIEDMTVGGNLSGNVLVRAGSAGANSGVIRTLSVSGTIGTPSSPITITVPGRIQLLSASAIHANISVDPSVSLGGALGRIETTSGDLTGSLTFRVFTNTGAPNPGIFVNGGNLDANVTATSSVSSIAQVSVATSGKKLAAGKTIRVNGSLSADLQYILDRL